MARRGHPIFAMLYDPMMRLTAEKHVAGHRRTLTARAGDRVLEIGAGTGANLPYYPAGHSVIAAEPDPHMVRRAAVKARMAPAQVHLVQAQAEALPFSDSMFDSVLCTLVLCSVDDPLEALREVWRVLRPGGQLLFFEHVRAGAPGWQRFQDVITPLWRRLGAGCHPNRDTTQAVRRAGFELVTLERVEYGPYPTKPHVEGVARKRAS
ncbi:MAG: class I SAM-dependent methyltransferase [Armatimonadetes bacterium]|nr:class I SAM-dependent methyltransferase [Armatimonadota bacterium]